MRNLPGSRDRFERNPLEYTASAPRTRRRGTSTAGSLQLFSMRASTDKETGIEAARYRRGCLPEMDAGGLRSCGTQGSTERRQSTQIQRDPDTELRPLQ